MSIIFSNNNANLVKFLNTLLMHTGDFRRLCSLGCVGQFVALGLMVMLFLFSDY